MYKQWDEIEVRRNYLVSNVDDEEQKESSFQHTKHMSTLSKDEGNIDSNEAIQWTRIICFDQQSQVEVGLP